MSLAAMIKATYASQGRSGVLGTNVVRAAAADPVVAAAQDIYTITGVVMVTMLVGIRTIVQAAGASLMAFQHSIGPTVLCVAAAITGNLAGAFYTITGNPLDDLVIGLLGVPVQGGLSGSQAVLSVQQKGIIMAAGTIQVTMTGVATTGSTSYVLSYIPISANGTVVFA